jgi:hypothetical protein
VSRRPSQYDPEWENKANWKYNVFYYSKADKRFVVPERKFLGRSIGWTINFAQPLGWAYLVFFALYLSIPAFLLLSEQVDPLRYAISMVGITASGILLTWWLSRMQR